MRLSSLITAARDATAGPGFDDVDEVCCSLEKAIEVIRFYADRENYDVVNGAVHDFKIKGLDRNSYKTLDCGDRARAFLKELGE